MSSLHLEYVTLDVFTATRFAGNPLAVVKVPRSTAITQEQKQRIAREFNYSETTFIHERVEGETQNHWTVDIFLTNREIPFAGHPTIGTACFALEELADNSGDSQSRGTFSIKAGPVNLLYSNRRASASIPHDVHIHQATLGVPELYRIQPALHTLKNNGQIELPEKSPVISIVKGMEFALVQLPDLKALGVTGTSSNTADIKLDEGWAEFHGMCYYYVRLPDSADGTINVRTRMIEGTLEDPATGSAASALTSYLSMQGEYSAGDTVKFSVVQGVEMGRQSDIYITIKMKEKGVVGEVILEGTAVKVMQGYINL
ncbi:MAG: hypothetical protein M1821_002242 [Bathelium mastoideum]|nr:MAG: hypothetical protein M1821_002242 [Bathelium mastoideum]KAI9676700.1 MAG: hypothetical protein M1822_008263 [Bathelium mastoideum]